MKLMKFLLGLTIGAGVALLFAPKSGRELREQLVGGATGRLLPAAPVEYPQPEHERDWGDGAVTVVAEPPVEIEVPAVVVEEAVVEEPLADDLKTRIEETRAAVENEIAQPFAEAEVADEAVVDAGVAEEAVAAEPAVEEEVVEEPVAEEPVVEEAVVEEPVAEEPAAEEPVAEEEAAEEPVAEEPAVESEVAEEPVAEEPVAEEPVAEEPVVEEAPAEERSGLVADIGVPVADVPVAEAEPVADEPATKAPTARESGSVDQAEMRRRIEETRARLKAKAFDAMMSGEAALLSRDSGEKPVPTGEDVTLDAEIDSTIDESLSQEEY